jgi:hypothetical protein
MDLDSNEDKYHATQEPGDKRSHAHLRDGLPCHSLQVQTILPAVLKMRMKLVIWQVNSHNPLSGHCPLKPEGV